eukprot:3964655-Alexandrium_andersonii.AAC.1
MQGDTHVDSMKGEDAIHEQGAMQGSVQGSVRAGTYGDFMKDPMQGDTMQGDTMQADIHIDFMQGDAINGQSSVQGSAQGSVRADTH